MVEVGFTSITVKWEPIPEGSLTSVLTGYCLRYRKLSDSEFKNSTVYFLQHQIKFTGLENDTLYSIQVAADTDSGVGVYSQEIITQTKQCMMIMFNFKITLYLIFIHNIYIHIHIHAALAFQIILVVLHV